MRPPGIPNKHDLRREVHVLLQALIRRGTITQKELMKAYKWDSKRIGNMIIWLRRYGGWDIRKIYAVPGKRLGTKNRFHVGSTGGNVITIYYIVFSELPIYPEPDVEGLSDGTFKKILREFDAHGNSEATRTEDKREGCGLPEGKKNLPSVSQEFRETKIEP